MGYRSSELLAQPYFLPETMRNWRRSVAQRIVEVMDFAHFGVKGVYLIGSAERETDGVGSDIDLIVHVKNGPEQQAQLQQWFSGWNGALCHMYALLSGYQTDILLDVHYVGPEEIRTNSSFATRMCSVYEPPELLWADSDNGG